LFLDEVEDALSYSVYNQVFEMRRRGEDVVSLAVGEPSFDTPKEIVNAARKSMERGDTHYSPSHGIPELRSAIAAKVGRRNGIAAVPGNTIFLPTKMAVFASIAATAGDGSEILIPDPGYFYHDPSVLAGAKPRWYRLGKDFTLDMDEIRRATTPSTKALLLNTPANPTGKVAGKSELQDLYGFCRKKGIHIISDEAYEDLTYGKEHFSVGSLEEKPDVVVSLFSLSKSFAMTGWRAGYAVASPKLVGAINRYIENTVSCFPAFIQHASLYALEFGEEYTAKFRAELEKRKQLIEGELSDVPGIKFHKAEGAFYSFPSYGLPMKSGAFCERLLKEKKLALLPGSIFGPSGEGHVRIVFSESRETITVGMERLRAFMSELAKEKPVQRAR
jgi:aspartate aminotransferase